MRFVSVRIAIVPLLLLSLAMVAAPAMAAEIPSREQVDQWAAALQSGKFLEREVATEQLVKVGLPAIEPVVRHIGTGLEATTRGIQILRELALSDDAQTEQAARDALIQVSSDTETLAGQKAATTLAGLNDIRRQRAITEIRRLGGQIGTTRFLQVQGAFRTVQSVFSVKIDEEWTGGHQGLNHLKWVPDIQQVSLFGRQVDDSWLAELEKLESLKILKLRDTETTAAGLAHLKKLPALERLTARSEKLDNAWLQGASQLENLRVLEIRSDRITNEGFAAIAALARLEQLSVYYSPIDDEALPTMKALKTASLFKLYGTKVTAAATEAWQAALDEVNPNNGMKIDHRLGAFLGVGCQQHEQGCLISMVHPDSAAAKAGIRPGDVITTYGGDSVQGFENLTLLISKHRTGNTTTIELLRNGTQKLQKEITLGEWEFDWN